MFPADLHFICKKYMFFCLSTSLLFLSLLRYQKVNLYVISAAYMLTKQLKRPCCDWEYAVTRNVAVH